MNLRADDILNLAIIVAIIFIISVPYMARACG